MPNRYLRESILTSEPVNTLGVHAEVFYRRLMSVVDDFGRFEANPKLIRAACYPLRVEEISVDDITKCLSEVESAGLVSMYTVNNKKYLEFHKLGDPRAKSSKFPAPCASANICAHAKTFAPSSITSSITPTSTVVEKDPPPGFLRWWADYPKGPRKVNRADCLRRWERSELEPIADAVIAGLRRWKAEWSKGDAKFICAALVFLNQRRWETELGDDPAPIGDGFDEHRKPADQALADWVYQKGEG